LSLRKGKNYRYGIHVPDMKALTKDLAIETMPAPETVYLSMSQHIGAPAVPIVAVGDKVKKGQLVGKENGVVSANVFSSVSGEIIAVTDMINGLGQKSTYVVVKNDFLNESVLFEEIQELTPENIIERVRLAGLVGLGGAGFPTAVKLSPKNPQYYPDGITPYGARSY